MHIERARRGGYRVRYAIADVAAFVPPGGRSTPRRTGAVETLYRPDRRTPLHPPVLSRGRRVVCCPDQVRPALLWTLDLDARRRAVPTSTSACAWCAAASSSTTPTVQAQLDAGTARRAGSRCSSEVGLLRIAARGRSAAASACRCPSRRSCRTATAVGGWSSARELPVEDWNAQISLLTGMAAAR